MVCGLDSKIKIKDGVEHCLHLKRHTAPTVVLKTFFYARQLVKIMIHKLIINC